MANTVNDVMNVIASPDYGIKNIAGTNQEILAILQGTHNSKNNIYNIVDDVKNLLQKLVDTNTKKKPVEIGGGNQSKINNKHIQDILDETKGIRKAIDNLSKVMLKQGKPNMPTVAKLSDKASKMVAEAMTKNINKQNTGTGLNSLIDAFNKLKDISLIDIFLGNKKLKYIKKIFKKSKEDLNIKEKELNNIIKLINAAPEVVNSLSKVSLGVVFILKTKVIEKLRDILVGKNSILTISKELKKNKKDIDAGTKAAKNITVFIGNLVVTSIFLTISIVPALIGTLGALALRLMVNAIIPTAQLLSKNNKSIRKAASSALILTAFTGLMLISSIFLIKVADNAKGTLLGALVLAGVVAINIFTFKILGKAKKNILYGAIAMAIMSASLILFGIALNKITQATKDVSWKQFGMIAAFLGLFGAATALLGIPVVAGLIIVGSIATAVMSISLLFFANTLDKISKATENLNMKQISNVAGSMAILGGGISLLAIMAVPIGAGSVVLGVMSAALHAFVKSFKIINDMGGISNKLVDQVLAAMKSISNFFIKNALNNKVVRTARRYKRMMRPFGNTIRHLAKLKKLGEVPIKLVYQTLNAMGTIANYYASNPISKDVIKQSRKYKRMMRPFGNTLKNLVKLKKLGEVPIGLVYQTLNAMSAIATYYENNPISKDAIKQSRKYKRMLKPFGNTLKYFVKLKELGEVPINLVYQTLNAMSAIANYYINNKIKNKAIQNSRKIKRLLRPFGRTVGYLAKLKELGEIPIKLVYQTLNAISAIVGFYQNQKMGNWRQRAQAAASRSVITSVVYSFGKVVDALKILKDLEVVPLAAINSTIIAIKNISWFYNTVYFSKYVKEKSILSEYTVDKFSIMAKNIQEKLNGIESVNNKAIISIIFACRIIIDYYRYTRLIGLRKSKVIKMNFCIKSFVDSANYLKTNLENFTIENFKSVIYSVKSMRRIMRFLKHGGVSFLEKRKVDNNLNILTRSAFAMSQLSKVNPFNMHVVGDALSTIFDDVKKIDISQMEAVTNMFNAFNGINKSENIINKFTESVKEFTSTCGKLINAMSNNTNAINNFDTGNSSNDYNDGSLLSRIKENVANYLESKRNNTSTPTYINNNSSVRIENVDELAKTIAEKINGSLSVDIPDTQVQLLINGIGGNEWTISRY